MSVAPVELTLVTKASLAPPLVGWNAANVGKPDASVEPVT